MRNPSALWYDFSVYPARYYSLLNPLDLMIIFSCIIYCIKIRFHEFSRIVPEKKDIFNVNLERSVYLPLFSASWQLVSYVQQRRYNCAINLR